jgi:hypothetical protein
MQRLVGLAQRHLRLVFASPRRLNLQILCKPKRPSNNGPGRLASGILLTSWSRSCDTIACIKFTSMIFLIRCWEHSRPLTKPKISFVLLGRVYLTFAITVGIPFPTLGRNLLLDLVDLGLWKIPIPDIYLTRGDGHHPCPHRRG